MRANEMLIALLTVTAIVAGRAAWDGGSVASIRDAGHETPVPTCTGIDDGWRDDHGDFHPWTAPLVLRSNGAALACPPQTGTMRFEVTGTAARGRHAHAVIVVGSAKAYDTELGTPLQVVLDVAADTPILMAFVNDLYRSPEEDRDLWVSPVTFETP